MAGSEPDQSYLSWVIHSALGWLGHTFENRLRCDDLTARTVHDQCAVGSEGGTKRLDQAERPSLDRSCGSEGRVHEQDPIPLDSKRAELVGYVGPTLSSRRAAWLSIMRPSSS